MVQSFQLFALECDFVLHLEDSHVTVSRIDIKDSYKSYRKPERFIYLYRYKQT